MSTDTLDRQHRGLAPLVTVTVAAMVFTILLIWSACSGLRWNRPITAAADINSLIAGNATAVAVAKAITSLGSNGVLWR